MDPERWRQIEKLYEAVRELEGGERARFLEKSSAGDAELRREVESLLRYASDGDGALGSHATGVVESPALERYRNLSLIGVGGMGEVYRARDSRLGRQVAIKKLPETLAGNAERVSRFRREARLLAALDHPHIAAIHELEERDGLLFLVMELVPGETLAERLGRGPIAMDEALPIASQIAEALEAAHEKGIIHRDLKPANIKVTPEGRVKVLDFGLAKMRVAEGAAEDLSKSPTLNTQSAPGRLLGTAAYMAPEQAKGREVDRRADIWAFGCVLYEMLTGKSPFAGDDVTDTLAKVLQSSPDWTALPSELSPTVRAFLKRCLERDRKQRVHDIGDVRLALEGAFETESRPAASPAASMSRRAMPIVATAAVMAVLFSAAWVLTPTAPAETGRVTRLTVPVPVEGRPVALGGWRAVAISPDGSRIAYTSPTWGEAGPAQPPRIYMKRMDRSDPAVLRGAEEAAAPFFSPDGQFVGFADFSGGAGGRTLRFVPVDGGVPQTIGEFDEQPWGMTWMPDETILFTVGPYDALLRIPVAGGEIEHLTTLDRAADETHHGRPELLPDGDTVLFTIYRRNAPPQLARVSLATLEVTRLPVEGSGARYAPTGHIVYTVVDETSLIGTLYAIRYDPVRGGLASTRPIPVLENVHSGTRIGQFGLAGDGTLVYLERTVPAPPQPPLRSTLALVNRDGEREPLDLEPARYRGPRVSPDGDDLAVEIIGDDGRSTVWIYDLTGQRSFRVLPGPGNNIRPIWTTDGDRITFASDRDGTWGIYWQPADGSGTAEPLLMAEEGVQYWPDSWSKDGTLAFTRFVGTSAGSLDINIGNVTVWSMNFDARGRPGPPEELFGGDASNAAFAPDGRWIAYRTQDSSLGPPGVRVEPFPRTGARYVIPGPVGSHPVWSRDGREMFYQLETNDTTRTEPVELAHIKVTADNPFTWGEEMRLPIEGLASSFGFRNYDTLPDGRLAMTLLADQVETEAPQLPPVPPIRVVLNWHQELLERVPVD